LTIYAIGDIHGEIGKLRSLLAAIEAESAPDSQLVFLGDYVDRGPDVSGVIEILIALREQRPNSVFLRGNHEQMMLESRTAFGDPGWSEGFESAAHWFAWGGAETLASYPRLPDMKGMKWYDRVPKEHWEFIESTTLEYRAGNYIFVHAGLVPLGGKWMDDLDPRLWIREPFIESRADFGGIVVFGHSPQQRGPLVMANKVGIDTAAAYGGPLTALALDPDLPFDKGKCRFLTSS
jgi:serine/threonine protein phosphatase 1